MSTFEAEKAKTSFTASCRPHENEAEADGIIHNLVRALAYIGMQQRNEPLGDFTHKYYKATKTMP